MANLVQSVTNTTGASSATTVTAALTGITAGNCLVAVVGCGTPAGLTCSLSDPSNGTWSGPVVTSNTTLFIQGWEFPSTQGGSITVTATFSASRQSRICLMEWAGLATSAPADQTATQSTTGTAVSVGPTASTSSAVEAVICATMNGSTVTLAAGAGYTLLTAGISNQLGVEYLVTNSPGSQTGTGTLSSSIAFDAVLFTLLPKAGVTDTLLGAGWV